MLLAFLVVIFRLIKIGLKTRTVDYQFLSLGFLVLVMVHLLVNIGSNLGLMPVTGISLPFVSYGGSNLLTLAILVGIMQRINVESRF